jgi:hypothetical protein
MYVIPRLKELRSGETVHLDRVPNQYSCAVILGPAGSGKTSALNFLAKGTPVRSLADLPTGALSNQSPSEGLVLLDEARAGHADYLGMLARECSMARIFASAEHPDKLPPDFARLLLQSFNEREISTAAEAWFLSADTTGHGAFKVVNRAAEAFLSSLKAHPRTRLLATNPLFLFLLFQVYTKGTQLPTHRAALFDTYVSAWLQAQAMGESAFSGRPGPPGDTGLAAPALEGIALATKRGQLAKEDHLARGYGLLHSAPSGRIEFVHPLLNDFFAARALRRNPDLAPLSEHMTDDDWREVVLFYAGLGDSRPLVETLLECDNLDLAALALAEAPEIPEDLNKRIVGPLIKRAWEQEEAGAAAGLRALRSNEATDFFAARLKERDPSARARAALILGLLNTDRAVEYLLPQLRDTDVGVRDQVVASLGQSTSDRVVEPLLVALRGDSRVGAVDTRMRLAAARALGEVGTERAVPALIVDLQVGEPEVRAQAVKALIKIRSDLARKPLRAIADSNQSSEVRAAADQVLQNI